MSKEKVVARKLLLGSGEVLQDAGVCMGANGEVLEIFHASKSECKKQGIPFYEGYLTPGFVNAHTHTELSFFKDVFVPGGSMVAFLRQIDSLRMDINQEIIDRGLEECYATFRREGIVAYADISNEGDTVAYKAKQSMRSVSFVEMFGANRELGDKAFATGQDVLGKYHAGGVPNAYLTPHAPYSVGRDLWAHMLPSLEAQPILSIHYCETAQEMEFMSTGRGAIDNLYRNVWTREVDLPTLDEVNETLYALGRDGKRMLLVHCTAITDELASVMARRCAGATAVLCPASNLFIEGACPNIELIHRSGLPIAIGTDSYSSAPAMSMLEQLQILNRYYPQFPVEQLLAYATRGGAVACGFDELGELKVGAKPGLNLIDGPGVLENKLTNAKVTVLYDLAGSVQ